MMTTSAPKPRLLLFDFDGVIINSEPLMRFAFADTCRRCGVEPAPPVERFLALMGMPLPAIVERLGLPRPFVAAYQALCKERMDMVQLYDGARAMLERGRARFHALGLVTGKDRQRTLLLLERFGLGDRFDAIVCGDDPHPGKPEPAAVAALRLQFAAAAHETYMVGDSPIDIECARRARVLAVGAAWGFSHVDELRRAGAHAIFSSPRALADWLGTTQRRSGRAATYPRTLSQRTGTDG